MYTRVLLMMGILWEISLDTITSQLTMGLPDISRWMSKCRFSVNLGPFTLAKTKIQKTWVFWCTVYTARKTHNIRVFWHKKRMREKPPISYWCFGKWCACATSLYLWPYTCSAHYVAGHGRVIPLKVRYHVTKNPNNTLRDWSRRLHWQKPLKNPQSFKNPTPEVGFFIRVFGSV